MKRIFILFISAVCLSLYGCGDDSIGGGGQCGGVAESGICTSIDTLAPKATDNVDLIRNSDCDGDTDTDDPETFTDHGASVTIGTKSYHTSKAAAKFVTFSSYTIDFSLSGGYTYAIEPPSISSKEYFETLKIDAGSSGSMTVKFMDLNTKAEVGSTWSRTDYPSYTATYTFSGEDDFGRSVEVRGFFTFSMGNFDNCSG